MFSQTGKQGTYQENKAAMSKIIYPFAAIPNQALRDGLGAINIAVLATIISHGRSTASAKTLAKEIGCDRKSVFSAINYWKENGPRYGIFLTTSKSQGRATVIEIEITTCTENGTPPVPKTVHPPVPKTVHPPVPKTVHKEEQYKKTNKEEYIPPLTPPRGDAAKPRGGIEDQKERLTEKITQPEDWLHDKQEHIRIIALYAIRKGLRFESKEAGQSFIRRNVRYATLLKGYKPERLKEVMDWLEENADFKWTLETVGKYIDENLAKLSKKEAPLIIEPLEVLSEETI